MIELGLHEKIKSTGWMLKLLIMNYIASPAFSLTTSLRSTIDLRSQTSPGPIYNISGTLLTSHAPTIPHSQRLPLSTSSTPAPDHYQPSHPSRHNPHAVIPQSKDHNPQTHTPSATWYKPQEHLVRNKSVTYSIGQRYDSTNEEKIPGPGQYQTSRTLDTFSKSKSVSSSKFSKTQRFKEDKHPTPAVGSYNTSSIDFLLGKKTTIPRAQPHPHKQTIPGPSDYHMKGAFEHKMQAQPGKTLAIRLKNHQEKQSITTFAFIKYFDQPEKTLLNKRSSEKYSIARSERQLFRDNELPGPTDYINDNARNRNSQTISIPKANVKHHNSSEANPGPGTYELSNQHIKTYSIAKSKSLACIAQTPGVGRYNMISEEKHRKTNAFPKGKRTSFISTNLAGVGDYEIGKEKKQAKLGFSKAARFGKQEQNQPGPGDYHLHSIIGYQNRKKTK